MNSFTKEEIIEVAKLQRIVCWLFLGVLLGTLAPVLGTMASILGLLTGAWALFYIYFLAQSLRVSKPWLYALGVLIPIVKLFVVFRVIRNATRVLHEHHIRVGLMGARKDDLSTFLCKTGGVSSGSD